MLSLKKSFRIPFSFNSHLTSDLPLLHVAQAGIQFSPWDSIFWRLCYQACTNICLGENWGYLHTFHHLLLFIGKWDYINICILHLLWFRHKSYAYSRLVFTVLPMWELLSQHSQSVFLTKPRAKLRHSIWESTKINNDIENIPILGYFTTKSGLNSCTNTRLTVLFHFCFEFAAVIGVQNILYFLILL